jgi:diaminohydroxyphosphoribosylaminopyrimidine deaminase/5-amino-6-(5-phosphoribosylamino)uracil reductase
VIVVTSPDADFTALRDAGAEIVVADSIHAALADLGRRNITSLFLEGGPTLAAAFVDAGEVDEARTFVAPILLGGSNRRSALDGDGDTLITARFREW